MYDLKQMDCGLMGVDWEERINFDRLRRERSTRAKQAVQEAGLDALFIFRYEDVRYVTGFRTHLGPTIGFGIASAVVPRDGEPILFTMDLDHSRSRMPWMMNEQIQPRANIREVTGIRKFVDKLEDVLGRKITGNVGIDILTPGMYDLFKQALPSVHFVDGYEVLLKAKEIKTQDEIACLFAATRITEAGMDAAREALQPGVRECEVLAAAWNKMTALGSEWTQCSNIVASGPYTAPYRRFTSDRIIRLGDPVVIDIGGGFNGYWGDFTRTWICGDISPTEEQKKLCQESYDSLFNACSAAQAGNTNADVYEAAGHVDLVSLGHSAGTSPWEPPYLSPESLDTPQLLEPNMILNIEPYKGKPGVGGFRLENNLLVTMEGPYIFTDYPFDERLLYEVHPLDRTTGWSSLSNRDGSDTY